MNEIVISPYYEEPAATIYLGDCREIMPFLTRGFDLLLTDPPYGIGESNAKNLSRGKNAAPKDYGEFEWDRFPVDPATLRFARGLCSKQIIFGGNYYDLPPCKGWLVWDKENGRTDFADGELAWNNLGIACRIKRHQWSGYSRINNEPRFHPTQKPLDVMQWCISLAGDNIKTILDPWGGSGTTAVAAKNLGRHCVLIEKEERWVNVAIQRLSQEVLPL